MSESQRRNSRVTIAKPDTKSQSLENSNSVKTKILKNQSLDTNIENSKQSVTNPSATLSIPEQNVRRHSIGTSGVASASIVQRLQQIAAESADQHTASDIDKTQAAVLKNNISSTTQGCRFEVNQPIRGSFPSASRGRAHQVMGRGISGINPGIRPMGQSRPPYLQNKRTSNPDLATVYTGMKEGKASLKPLENQIAARRYSSDMRIADFNNFRGGNINQATAEHGATTAISSYKEGNIVCFLMKTCKSHA